MERTAALSLFALIAVGCATPKTIVEIPSCADRVELTGQGRQLSESRFELDHTFDLPFTKTELTFASTTATERRVLVLENEQPEPVRAVVGSAVAVVGALLLSAAWYDTQVEERALFEERPFYETIFGAGMVATGALTVLTGWHPTRAHVTFEGVCPAGVPAPGPG